jgi:hypothetical protein
MAGKQLKGSASLRVKLAELAAKVSKPGTLRVGFLEDAIYDDGTPVAYIAAINEFGARIEKEPGETTVYRQVNKARTGFNKKGRFVKKSASNFATTHYVSAHVITIPPRPFFRTMIANEQDGWGGELGKHLVATKYNVDKSLSLTGELLDGQLAASIDATVSPQNAKSTIAKKGFDKPLIDTGYMRSRIAHDVKS